MLKFSDLRIDFESFDNTFNSYMKLFPNSYMPLLIMFLSREGLLEVASEVKDDASKILLSVTKDELVEMIRPNLTGINALSTSVVFYHELFGVPCDNGEFTEKCDNSIILACSDIINVLTNGANICSLLYHSNGDENIDKIVKIIQSNSRNFDEKAALFLFWNIFINKVHSRSDDEYAWEFEEAVKCFETAMQRILLHFGVQECWQPLELTRIILSQYPGGSVYNPFAGVASYHTVMSYGLRGDSKFEFDDKPEQAIKSLGDNYYGEEINELTWAIGKMRLMFYQMDSANYVLGDSCKRIDIKVNNIISTPPFNLQVINETGDKEYADHLVLRRGLDMLADDGMIAVVVPMSFLSRKDTYDIRKEIFSKRLGVIVVYLPENVFLSTKIRTAILFVNKCRLYSQNVKFVDATKMIAGKKGGADVLKVVEISNLIEHDEHPMDRYPLVDPIFTFGDMDSIKDLTSQEFNAHVSIEPIENVVDNDYDLSPSKYFSSYIDIPKGYKLVNLKELVSTQASSYISEENVGKVVTIANLANDYQLPYINVASLESKNISTNYQRLDTKALLLSSINELKPSIYVPTGADVYLSPNVVAFQLDDKKVNAEYLVGELSKDYVKEQVRLKTIGSNIHRINYGDMFTLQVLVPDSKDYLEKEKEISQERKNIYLEKMGVELAELKDRRHDEYVKMLRQRKHRLQQIMNEFAPAFAQLNNCRIKQGGVLHDEDIAAARTGETVGSYFDKLNNIVGKVENLVTNLVNKDNWGETSDINIDNFVDTIPQSHFSDKYEIQVYHDRDYEVWEEGETADLNDPRIVKIDENSLSTLFENIIANASKWGFNDNVRRDYLIRITVSDGVVNNQNAVRISVANNGTPIHESVDRSRFFEWGYGTGTGIGTSQLKDIVEHYGGSIKLNENLKDSGVFCTEYEIFLPIIDFN